MANKIEAVVDSTLVKGVARASLMLVIPLSIWGIGKLYDMNNSIVALQTQMTERTGDRYSGTDARRDGQNYLNLIGRSQQDINTLFKGQRDLSLYVYQNVSPRH